MQGADTAPRMRLFSLRIFLQSPTSNIWTLLQWGEGGGDIAAQVWGKEVVSPQKQQCLNETSCPDVLPFEAEIGGNRLRGGAQGIRKPENQLVGGFHVQHELVVRAAASDMKKS